MEIKFLKSAFLSFIFLSSGFILLYIDVVGYGIAFFCLLPFLLGYALAGTSGKNWSLGGLLFALVIFIILLIAGQLEGMLCVLMAAPLVALAIWIGTLIRGAVDKRKRSKDRQNNVKFTIIPLIVFVLFGMAENQWIKRNITIMEVSSEILLPYSALEVYDAIKSVDTLDADKAFLMKLDLPVPLKCVLEEEKVGALRTCYFEGGNIVERITELEPGKVLKMDVIDYQLTGRHWLGFHEAIYYFEDIPNGHSKMTRITTYSSALYPRFYWGPLERWGIEEEHGYVFANLKKDLEKTNGSD